MGRPKGTRGGSPSVLLALVWALFIAYGTLLPFDFRFDLGAARAKIHALGDNLSLGRRVSRADVVSNVLLFVPWGVLASWSLARRGVGPGVSLTTSTLGGLALSASVECGQLFLPSRTTSPVDLATNTLGAALGALMGGPMARRVWPAWSPALRRLVAARPVAACALASTAGLLLAGLAPFNISLDLGDLKASVGRARPIPFGPTLRGGAPSVEPWSWALETLTWSLAGGLTLLALREAGRRNPRTILTVIFLCTGLALLIETEQLAIPARDVDLTSVALAALGALAGALIVSTSNRSDPRRWIGPALAVWTACAVLAAWTPPNLAPALALGHLRWSRLVPFWAYYRRTDLSALADLIEQVLRFVPFGALLAARHRYPSGITARAAWLGFALGLILEAGQLLLADRTAEITDALSAALGATLGARLWIWGTSIRTETTGHARYRVR